MHLETKSIRPNPLILWAGFELTPLTRSKNSYSFPSSLYFLFKQANGFESNFVRSRGLYNNLELAASTGLVHLGDKQNGVNTLGGFYLLGHFVTTVKAFDSFIDGALRSYQWG